MEKKEWTLLRSSTSNVAFVSCVNHCLSSFELWRTSRAKMITYEEYLILLKAEKISSAVDLPHVNIRFGRVGIICLTKYADEPGWHTIWLALEHFFDGWRWCCINNNLPYRFL